MGILMCSGIAALSAALLTACAAPSPTATPTQPLAAVQTPTKAAPTPTKAPTATPTKRPLVKAVFVSSSLTMSWATIWLARSLDLFKPEGLDVEYVQTGGSAKTIAALVQGDAQFGALNATELTNAIAAKVPVQAVAALSNGPATQVMMRTEVAQRLGITEKTTLDERIRLLRGLTVASSSEGSPVTWEIRFLLAQRGMDAGRDIDLIFMNATSMIPAIEQGSIDAFGSSPPYTATALYTRKTVLLWNSAEARGAELPALEITLAANKRYGEANSDIIEATVRGVWQAQRVLRDDRQRARNALYSLDFYQELERPVFDLSFDLHYPVLTHDPTLRENEIHKAIAFRNLTVPLQDQASLSFEEFGTNRFVEAAKKQLGY